jgi:hypothetical protein
MDSEYFQQMIILISLWSSTAKCVNHDVDNHDIKI